MRSWASIFFTGIFLIFSAEPTAAISIGSEINLGWEDSTENDLEKIVYKEMASHQHELKRRQNSGINHGYLINYNRCEFWANPRVNANLRGIVKAQFTVVGNRDSVGFDLISTMQIDSVWGRSGPLAFYRQGNGFYVTKSGGWKDAEIDSIWVAYQGNPAASSGGFGYYVLDNHKTGAIIHTLSEPYGAPYWWPCKQSMHDKIDSLDIVVHTDTGLRVASNGLLMEEGLEGAQGYYYHWKHRYPIASYLVAIAITNYAAFTDTVQFVDGRKMPVLNYCFPQFSAKWQADGKGVLAQLRMYDSLFVKYPFAKEKYGHAQFTWGGGMEHQTMSFMADLGWDLMAHELAHQWFGDLVTCSNWGDLWLNEGFATYVNALAHEFLKGDADFRQRLKGMRDDVTSKDWGSVYAWDTLNVNNLFSGRLTYNKGAWVIHMLRDKMGDSLFFAGLRNYLSAKNQGGMGYGYGFASSKQFRQMMEYSSGMQLDTFFKEWIYGAGFPYLDIRWKQRGKELALEIRQKGSDVSVPYFHTKLALRFFGKTGDTILHFYLNDSITKTGFMLPFGVMGAEFDPRVNLLGKANIEGVNLDELQASPFVVSPNPVDNEVKIFARNGGFFMVEIYDILGRLIWQGDNSADSSKELIVPVEYWSEGVYTARINDQSFVYSIKFLKR